MAPIITEHERVVRIYSTAVLTFDQAKPTETPTFQSDHGVARGKPARNVVVQSLRLHYTWDEDANIWRCTPHVTVRPWLASGGLGAAFDAGRYGYFYPAEADLEEWVREQMREHAPTFEPVVTWTDR